MMAAVKIGEVMIPAIGGVLKLSRMYFNAESKPKQANFETVLGGAVKTASCPSKSAPELINKSLGVLLLTR